MAFKGFWGCSVIIIHSHTRRITNSYVQGSDQAKHDRPTLRLTMNISVEGSGGAPEAKEQMRIFGWPVSIAFIVFTEFCERFCYYGMRSKIV